MRIAGQILQNLLRSSEWRLGKDDPFDFSRLAAQRFERAWLHKTSHLSMEPQLAVLKRFSQVPQEHIPEPGTQHLPGEKERLLPAADPPFTVRSDAATRYHAVEMRM